MSAYVEMDDDADAEIRTAAELGSARASELLAASHVACANGTLSFVLHNYAEDGILHLDDFRSYASSGGSLAGLDPADAGVSAQWTDLAGGATYTLRGSDSVRVSYGGFACDGSTDLLVVTPAREMMVIEPPVYALPPPPPTTAPPVTPQPVTPPVTPQPVTPPPPEDTDTDGDGIRDTLDLCPDDPETVNGHLDTDGCPDTVPTDTDTDGDGIPRCHRPMRRRRRGL